MAYRLTSRKALDGSGNAPRSMSIGQKPEDPLTMPGNATTLIRVKRNLVTYDTLLLAAIPAG